MKIRSKKTITNIKADDETIGHAKKEIKMDDQFVKNIIKKENYRQITKDLAIGKILDTNFLQSKFSCHMDLEKFNQVPIKKQHLITGFGPTNSPTGGTLSMILRALFFEKETGIDSTIIISNLGAYNSRNIKLGKIDCLTDRFIKFIRALGYKGGLRTHNDFELLVASSLTSKVLSIDDFRKNKEVTAELYKKMKVLGGDFPIYIDANYTIADILLPVILEKKERVLVFVGIEEYYFPKMANSVLQRFNKNYLNEFTPKKAHISSIFGNLIGGLNGFPKMSKSIPDSSINLNDSYKILKDKILNCRPEDEKIIFQMMTLVSDWSFKKINNVTQAYNEKGDEWINFKKEYLEYFIKIKNIWESTADNKYKFNVKTLFKQNNK